MAENSIDAQRTVNQIEILLPRGGDAQIVYKFKQHPRMVKEIVKLDSETRRGLNNLMENLISNNFNSEIKITRINGLKNVLKVSNQVGEGVCFRYNLENLEILGQFNHLNENKIIELLKEFGY